MSEKKEETKERERERASESLNEIVLFAFK